MTDFTPDIAFNSNAQSYNADNALWLGQVAKLAYQDFHTVKRVFTGWKAYELHDLRTDTQGFVVSKGDVLVIAFRGTEPIKIKDWLTDLQIVLTHGPEGKVHEGFYTRLLAIWQQLNAALTDLGPTGKKIWITGHSLGAALAALAAAKLQKDGCVDKINGLYTYGQPRAGDRRFTDWLDSQMRPLLYRHVNNKDLVTNIPPFGLYKHAGTLVYFNDEGERQTDTNLWKILKAQIAEDSEKLLQGKYKPEAIRNHSMEEYLTVLQKNL